MYADRELHLTISLPRSTSPEIKISATKFGFIDLTKLLQKLLPSMQVSSICQLTRGTKTSCHDDMHKIACHHHHHHNRMKSVLPVDNKIQFSRVCPCLHATDQPSKWRLSGIGTLGRIPYLTPPKPAYDHYYKTNNLFHNRQIGTIFTWSINCLLQHAAS